MIFHIDTNIVVFCLRGRSAAAMGRLQSAHPLDVFLPLQTHAELLVGAAKSANPAQTKARVTAFIAPFRIAWPDAQVEEHYVDIRSTLERSGTSISEADLWIAATARSAAATLITNNIREFARVPNLLIADWTLP